MTQKKSPSLEVISKSGENSANDESSHERRRLPRLSLTAEQFRLASTGKIFPVTDVSANGMALRVIDLEDLRLFPIAAALEGTLNLRREKHPVSAKVRRLGGDSVGLEFESLSPETKQALSRLLDPAVLGRELKPIPSEGQTLWYHGPSGTDLLFWRGTDGQYRRVMLLLMGSFVQWDQAAGLTTGKTESSSEMGETRGILRFETMLLDTDTKLDAGKLSVAKTLVMSSNLPQDLKKWCIRHFERS